MAGRRCNGEGSIYKRGDGRWAASVSLGDGRRKTYYGRTRDDVSQKLAKARYEVQQGLPVIPEKETVGAYLARWLEEIARPAIRATTYEAYERNIRLHVNPRIGRVRMARLSPDHLSRLYGHLLSKGLAPKTIRQVHAIIHRALRQALRLRLVAVNAAEAVDPPRLERKEFRTLSPEEAKRLLHAAKGDRLEALYVLALTTGMREGELLGLRWSDIDFDSDVLAVRQQVQRVRGQWLFSEPKTAKGRRVITLPESAVGALKRHRARQSEVRLEAPIWDDHDLVFPNGVGRPIGKWNLLRRSFVPLLERAGLPRIRFHDLRHTAATLLLSLGEHPKVVQERLGHSTIAMTMDIYSHVMPTLQRQAADRLDTLLAVPGSG